MRLLRAQIKQAAKKEDFHLAAGLKKQLDALVMAQTSQKIGGSFLESNPEVDHQLNRLVGILGARGIRVQLERIECFDMATLGQLQTVGSMVVFSLGVIDKSQYRRFRVRNLQGGDPHNMAEVIQRRFNHPEWPEPGLIVLDGGKPQLAIAGSLVPKGIPVLALAKKEEILFLRTPQGVEEINLPQSDPGLKLLMAIRDEAHRFATGYHGKIRRRELIDRRPQRALN